MTSSPGSRGFTVILTVALASLVAIATVVVVDRTRESTIVVRDGTGSGVVVFIDGAVATPGLVELPSGARLATAIDAAGGTLPHASFDDLNLAAQLVDGEHITIPSSVPTEPATDQVADVSLATPESGLVNINTATAAELDGLPDIGPVLSERIVAYRDLNGPFESVDELDDVEGISPTLVEALRPLITVDE